MRCDAVSTPDIADRIRERRSGAHHTRRTHRVRMEFIDAQGFLPTLIHVDTDAAESS